MSADVNAFSLPPINSSCPQQQVSSFHRLITSLVNIFIVEIIFNYEHYDQAIDADADNPFQESRQVLDSAFALSVLKVLFACVRSGSNSKNFYHLPPLHHQNKKISQNLKVPFHGCVRRCDESNINNLIPSTQFSRYAEVRKCASWSLPKCLDSTGVSTRSDCRPTSSQTGQSTYIGHVGPE